MIAVGPLLLSLFSALVVAALGARPATRFVSVALSALHLGLATWLAAVVFDGGAVVLQMAAWKAPFGITFFIDGLAAIMIWISSFLAFGVHFYSLGSNGTSENRSGFPALYHFQMVGVCGAFATNDLFNLYVWFEVLLLASFALMASAADRKAISGTLIYVVLNLVGSAFFLFGLGLLYNSTGTLNFAELLALREAGALPATIEIVAGLLFVAFALKAGVVPFAQWLPASYPAASIASLSLFAGLLTKIGVYTLMRFVVLGLGTNGALLMPTLTFLSLATMLIGVLGAASSKSLRHILSYHIISQVGYMTLAVSFGTVGAMLGAIFYLVHHMVVKTSLFLVAGLIEKSYGSSRLEDLGGLSRTNRGLVFFFAVPALSLAGIPPFSGFWAKLLVLRESLALNAMVSASFVIVVGLLTLFSMSKIWSEAFQKKPEQTLFPAPVDGASRFFMKAPLAMFCGWIILLGSYPKPFLELSRRAAESLVNPRQNIERVLDGAAKHEGGSKERAEAGGDS